VLGHHLRHSHRNQHLKALQALSKKGVIAPIDEAPPVHAPYLWLWNAFCALAEKRGHGSEAFYPLPITVSEITALANYTGVTGEDDRALLMVVISALDRMTISDYWDKRAEQTDNAAQRRQHR
jgi:hypothetical protein